MMNEPLTLADECDDLRAAVTAGALVWEHYAENNTYAWYLPTNHITPNTKYEIFHCPFCGQWLPPDGD